MSSSLSRIPAEKRRLLAATLGLFAMLFVAVGAVAATGANSGALKAFMIGSLVIGALLALVAWGVAYSVKVDSAERDLDAVLRAAVAARPGSLCSCGHDHDPSEMHVKDAEACSHDGTGIECGHNCESCVLAALRPSPHATRAERAAEMRS